MEQTQEEIHSVHWHRVPIGGFPQGGREDPAKLRSPLGGGGIQQIPKVRAVVAAVGITREKKNAGRLEEDSVM